MARPRFKHATVRVRARCAYRWVVAKVVAQECLHVVGDTPSCTSQLAAVWRMTWGRTGGSCAPACRRTAASARLPIRAAAVIMV